jgi:hypothetical protein
MKKCKNLIFKSLVSLSFIISFSSVNAQEINLNATLLTYCKSLPSEFNQISDERKADLNEIAN